MAPTLYDHNAKPGDLIQIHRGSYKHWAVYIGENEVVHLIPSTTAEDLGPLASLAMLLDSNSAEVRQEKIWEVARFDRYEVNNLLDDEYKPRERHVIVREACSMVGQIMPYCIATQNCEHFVTRLRYGKPESRQVRTVATVAGVAVAGVGLLALSAAVFSLFKEEDKEKRRHH